MVARRRTSRIALQLTARWLRPGRALPITVADMNAHGLFLADQRDMPLGELQQIEVDLPTGPVRLLVVPRYNVGTEWAGGVGVEIFAASPLDRNLWMWCFETSGGRHRRGARALRAVG